MRHLEMWNPVLVCRSIIPNGLDLTDVPILPLRKNTNFLSKAIKRLYTLLDYPQRNDVKLLRNEKAQLLHVHFAIQAIDAWPLAKASGLPMLVTLHGLDINIYKSFWTSGKGGRQMKSYPSKLLKLSNEKNTHFIAVSEAIKTRAIQYGLPPAKIKVRYIGVDTQRFAPSHPPLPQRNEILFIGRLVEKKGCQYLLEAFKGIKKQHRDCTVTIIGTGPLEQELRNFAEKYSIQANFLGSQTSDQVRERMKQARMLCLPSITAKNGDAEGLPIVILEAQSSGIPVITSARGGATEGIIPGKTGFAHQEKDVLAIRNAIETLLEDEEILENFGLAAREHVIQTFDIKNCTRKLEETYNSIASDK